MDFFSLAGFITGIWDVWLCARENILNWPVGLLNCAFFLIVFLQTGLYGSAFMQIFYIGLGIWGWYQWLYGGEKRTERKIRALYGWELVACLIFGFAGTFLLTEFFMQTNDPAPFMDAFTTILSLIATYMLALKITENWYLWISADVIFIVMYFQQGLTVIAVTYILFLLICLKGIWDWKQTYSKLVGVQL